MVMVQGLWGQLPLVCVSEWLEAGFKVTCVGESRRLREGASFPLPNSLREAGLRFMSQLVPGSEAGADSRRTGLKFCLRGVRDAMQLLASRHSVNV